MCQTNIAKLHANLRAPKKLGGKNPINFFMHLWSYTEKNMYRDACCFWPSYKMCHERVITCKTAKWNSFSTLTGQGKIKSKQKTTSQWYLTFHTVARTTHSIAWFLNRKKNVVVCYLVYTYIHWELLHTEVIQNLCRLTLNNGADIYPETEVEQGFTHQPFRYWTRWPPDFPSNFSSLHMSLSKNHRNRGKAAKLKACAENNICWLELLNRPLILVVRTPNLLG